MTTPQPSPQVEDPFGDARDRLLQALAVLATVGEAAARWYAVGLQNKAAAEERAATADRAAEQARRHAERLAGPRRDAQATADRERIDLAFTDWLDRADFAETAELWRTAAVHAAAGNPRAAEALHRAEARLRVAHPQFMGFYDRHRTAGDSTVEAMHAAAYDLWEHEAVHYPPPRGRPHPGPAHPELVRPPLALPPGGQIMNDLDTAVRAEAARLAAHVSPQALDRLQRTWREQGREPAADAAGLLAQFARDAANAGAMPDEAARALAAHASAHADRQHRDAVLHTGTGDDPDTVADEHAAGQDSARREQLGADHDQAHTAAGARQQRLGVQAFPQPPLATGTVAPAVAGKTPATVASRQRGRGR